jgi:DNA (cytosine-5)-methyltransferase 1
VKALWFTKIRRAQNDKDFERWEQGGVHPTLNTFDNGDTRSVAIVFHPHRHDGVRIQDKTSHTLTAYMGTGGNNMPMVSTTKVRRLLPLECERLQGFPDGWTEGQADTQRYKQIGNAVAVPVVEWIVGQLVDYDKQTRP